MNRDGFLCGRRCIRGANRGPLIVIQVAAALVAFSHPAVMATTYYWDPLGPGSVGGSGVWDAGTADWSPNSTGGSDLAWPDANPNGDQAVFSGAAGTVSLNQTGDPIFVNGLSFQASYTINGPATGRSTLNLSGTSPTMSIGNNVVTLNTQLTGTHGFTEVGSGTLILGGDNSRLSGTVNISTNVLLDTALSGSANAAWNLNGGVIAYYPSVGGTGQTVQLGALSGTSGMLTNEGTAGTSDVITYAIGSLGTNTTFGGVIADSGGGSGAGDRTALNKVGNPTIALAGNNGNQTLTLLGINTYSGPTNISGGTLLVVGSIGRSSSIALTQGGTVLNPLPSTLELNPSSATLNQIGDTTPITLEGGTLEYIAATGSQFSETVGVVSLLSGLNTLVVNSTASGTATVSAAAFNRLPGGGTAIVSGTNLGLNTTATSDISRILLAAAPTLVGSGAITTTDTPSEHNAPIVPFLLGFSGGTGSSFPDTFITYSPAGGLRPLNPADEFSATPTSGQNTRIAGSTTVSSNVSINSLIVDSGTLTIGTGTTLAVASGAVLINGSHVTAIAAADASGTLSFNNGEAIISAFAISPFANLVPIPVSANLANLTQLTIQGTSGTSGSNIILTQSSNTSDSAPVNLLSGTLSVAQDYDLGYATGGGAITFPAGGTAALRMTGNQFSTSKGISLQGNAIFIPYQIAATFAGPISGPGGLQVQGDALTFSNPANTYSGMTVVDSVSLYLSANSNNNIPNSSMILAGSGAVANPTLNASGLTAPGGFQLHAGQTLAGIGTVVPPAAGLVVSSGAVISAGDGVSRTGRLATSGLQIWNGGGEYLWKIDLTNAGTPGALNTDKSGAHWDQLTMSNLSVAANSSNPFQIQIDGLTGSGTNTFDPTRNYAWVVANMPVGAATGNLVGAFTLSVSGLSNYKIPGSFSAALDSTADPGFTDLLITYTATPEPTALTLLFPAAGFLLVRRRSVHFA
jgi:fibronectin-binding autotransporter adhesin